MARQPAKMTSELYLITPRLSAAAPFEASLRAALAAAKIACVLLRLETRDVGEAKKIIRALAPLVQEAGAALLVDNDAQAAARAGADGAHLRGEADDVAAAIESLKPDRIVGAQAPASRDACMIIGEMDVDYLMFGGPDEDADEDQIFQRAQWWAEIFNVPCVAYAHRLADVAKLAQAGAEFIGLENAVWTAAEGPASAVRAAAVFCAENAR